MTGVVLAGGKGVRIKRAKPLLRIGDRPILRRICEVFEPLFQEKIIVIAPGIQTRGIRDNLEGFSGWRICEDIIPGRGPLSGLHAALTLASADYSFVAACDMPFLNEDFLRHMMTQTEGCDIVVPYLSGRYEPIHAIYSKSCLPIVTELLGAGSLSVLDLYPRVKVRRVEENEIKRFDPDLRMFFNINTEEDLSRALELDLQ